MAKKAAKKKAAPKKAAKKAVKKKAGRPAKKSAPKKAAKKAVKKKAAKERQTCEKERVTFSSAGLSPGGTSIFSLIFFQNR